MWVIHIDTVPNRTSRSAYLLRESVRDGKKVRRRTLPDATPAMRFTRLLAHLATVVRNTLRPKGARAGAASFTLTTRPNPKQQQALDRIAAITM